MTIAAKCKLSLVSLFLCLSTPFSNVLFLVSVDLRCKPSEVESRAVSQLLPSTRRSFYGGTICSARWIFSPLPGERGIMGGNVMGVVWHGARRRAPRRVQFGSSRWAQFTQHMWNNNDRKPADLFSHVTPHDPRTIYPIRCWDGLLFAVMLSFYVITGAVTCYISVTFLLRNIDG